MKKHLNYLINGGHDSALCPLDRGLSYGDGVFRTFKVIEAMPTDWPRHYQKLVADCGAIGIVCPSAELLISDIHSLFDLDEVAVAKIIITRGQGERGYAPPAVTMPTRIVVKSAIPQYTDEYFTEGVTLHVCTTTLSHQPLLAGIKHLNRLENVLARAEWSDPMIAEGLMLDADGHVIECTSANLFARFGDTLYTPSLSKCGIAGVTRQKIMDIAHYLTLKTVTQDMTLAHLFTADEVIICNSMYGAWQVRAIANQHWQKGSLAEKIRPLISV